ncbi:LysR family transcriptional regulator [Pseudorhodoferax sp.]|uniref:LysR family transcriptional regulator n=1 Tax=Pseudorhodoferax sp. TaxID=1993553 RepID=UPI0039E2A0E8
MLDLTHLRTFVAVMQEGHLTRAAERLHISQPAASHHIRALEQQFGLPLFTRTARGLAPTAAGMRLAEGARRLLGASIELASLARELRGSPAGRLVVGTIADPQLLAWLPALVRWIQQHYPLVELSIEARISPSIRQGVLAGELEAGFFVERVLGAGMEGFEVGTREFMVAAPAAWREQLAGADWAALAALPWIVTPPGTSHAEIAERLFQPHGVRIRPVLEVGNEMLVRAMVASGLGLGFVRREFAEEGVALGTLCTVPGSTCGTALQFGYAAVRRTDPLIQLLIAGLREVLADAGGALAPPGG